MTALRLAAKAFGMGVWHALRCGTLAVWGFVAGIAITMFWVALFATAWTWWFG